MAQRLIHYVIHNDVKNRVKMDIFDKIGRRQQTVATTKKACKNRLF